MSFPLQPQPRPRPRLLDQRQRKADLYTIDRAERQKCRERSGGRCEVVELVPLMRLTTGVRPVVVARCYRRASENHHLIGGSGRRNKGRSIKSDHRLDVCATCHREITNHVLVPCVEQKDAEWAHTVRYERVR